MEKKKNLGTPRLKSMPFLMLWMSAYLIVWMAFYFILDMHNNSYNSETSLAISIGLIMGFGLALMPMALIRYTYRDMLKGWIPATIIGWVVSWLLLYHGYDFLEDLFPIIDDSLGLMLIPLFGLPAILQWFVLRRHTRHAWLWIIAGVASAMAFGVLYGDSYGETIWQFMLGASGQGAVTGLTLLWMYGQSRVEKIKAGA